MARVVYKYTFGGDTLVVPPGEVKLVAYQEGDPYPTVWIEHYLRRDGTISQDSVGPRCFRIFDTGSIIPNQYDSWRHIGSCVCGVYVWHVYEERNPYRG